MASIKSSKFFAPKFMAGDGCGTTYVDTATLTALAVGDTIEFNVPAGAEVHTIDLDFDDVDSNGAPAFAFKAGYKSIAAEPALATNDSYFGTGLTLGRTAGRGSLSFKPITFNESAAIVLTVTAAPATFQAGSVAAIVGANCVGVK